MLQWGKGIYFAQKASYSNSYAHAIGTAKQMFLATVLVGDDVALPSDPKIRFPPQKPNGSLNTQVEKFDSVKGNTGGSDVWIIYDNGRAYPSYLISYK